MTGAIILYLVVLFVSVLALGWLLRVVVLGEPRTPRHAKPAVHRSVRVLRKAKR